ncbi:nonsense-mediated mRNA decay factor SMG9-like [Hydractinia symbiolongicarpus]|uniref:nonsense-mediated mRNA decay factor SMG9-like n=1 Tax=Hydractinia symbiolongicarpus TaxID=13093 RepID=UPI00254D5AC7|nr:nonsense-mediated mRNA decay factor SMG9-like [Hydractinia symbiolongicarpus]XP_057302384.1 nonsense-mediated mRNA decay factor SMG9-like [Hydractinia symbiolongicarpus]
MDDETSFSQDQDKDYYRRGDRRDRGNGRRRDRKPRERIRRDRDRSERQENENTDNAGSAMKTPIILAKKSGQEVEKKETPTILAIQRRSGAEGSSSPSSSNKTFANDSRTQYHKHGNRYEKTPDLSSPATPIATQHALNIDQALTGLAALKLPQDIYSSESTSIIDGSFQWSDRAFETLLDQTDYVVVGCVGLQGAGKSTVMSMLAGQQVESLGKTRLVFRPQKRTDLEKCTYRTVGIDMYVTHERLILLDTQPLLSPAMLDQYLRYDRKIPGEYTTAEICLEVQALQILTFLYTICHVVLVIQDHFTDLNLLNLLKTAEMLKLSTVSHSNQDGSGLNADELNEYFPHVAFIYTCCDGPTYELNIVRSMCEILWKLFETSRLRVRGSASIIRTPVLPYCQSDLFYDFQDFNLFLLPAMRQNSSTDEEDYNPIGRYRGHPSLSSLVKVLRQQLLSMPRESFTHHILSERSWFHYAARTWEAVKKSSLMSEYHRLLSS